MCSVQSWEMYIFLLSLVIYSSFPESGAVTWQPEGFRTVPVVEGSSATFVWKIVFDNTNQGVQRTDVLNVDTQIGSTSTMIYKLKDSVNATVDPAFKSREKDLELLVLLNTTTNTATIKFTLHNINLTVDDGRTLRVTAVLIPTYQPTTSSDTTLVVQARPTINMFKCQGCINETNGTVVEYNNISLLCGASGKPQPSITWMRDGAFYANGSLLIILSITREQRGNYTCIADNGVVKPDSKTLEVIVQYPPDSFNCSNKTVVEGDDVQLVCNATGNPPPDMTWTRNGNIQGMGSTLVKNNVNRSDDGIYIFLATNSLGYTRTAVFLTVQYPPDNLTCSNKTVVEGSNVQLVCNVNGNPPPDMMWTRNGNSKAMERTLLINNVNRGDDGIYIFLANNSLGYQRKAVFLTVQYSATCRIYPNASNVIVNETDQVNLTCKSEGNPKAKDFLWTYPNGSSLPGSYVLQFIASKNDVQLYQCSVYNGIGDRGNCSRNVDVQYKPAKANLSCPSSVCVNQSMNMMCQADAHPKVQIYTLHHGKGPPYKSVNGTFSKASSDSGVFAFSCSGSNVVGPGPNDTCKVNVFGNFRINCMINNESVTSKTFNEGDKVSLWCNTTSSVPGLLATWKKVNKTIILSKDGLLSLNFSSVNRIDSGTYEVSIYDPLKCNLPRNESFDITINFPSKIKAHLALGNSEYWNEGYADKSSDLFKALNINFTREVQKVYSNNTSWRSVEILNCVRGSVIVYFILNFFGVDEGSLQPLISAADRGITIYGMEIQNVREGVSLGKPPSTTTTTPTITTATTITTPTDKTDKSDKSDNPPIVIIIVVVIVVIILLIVLVICCIKKKRSKKNGEKDKENVVAIDMEEDPNGRNNEGFSSSEYADRGPDANPAYASGGKSGDEEPAYAAVDRTKKTKKKDPNELTYAELGEFQKKREFQPTGSGAIVLEHPPKGEHVKMPDKYEDTIYAEIVGTKKKSSDTASTEEPLKDLHKNNDPPDKEDSTNDPKSSGGASDPTKETEQKAAAQEKSSAAKAPDQPVQPPTKEDSADSLLTTRSRNDTTLTTVSL